MDAILASPEIAKAWSGKIRASGFPEGKDGSLETQSGALWGDVVEGFCGYVKQM
ncbi:MAG: hypothetical protein ACAH83_09850 [Alphaproteobacteria bacterium]